MTRKAALSLLVVAWLWCFGFAALARAADTPASCTTDTATTYCEQVPAGTNSDASSDGFVIALSTMGVLLSMSFGYIVLRKVFAAAGWGSW